MVSAGVVCRGKNIQRTRYMCRSSLQISRDQATRMPPLTSSFAYPGYANAANTAPRGLREHTTRTGPQTDENNVFRHVLSLEFRRTSYASPHTLPRSYSERSTVAVVLPREEQGSCRQRVYAGSAKWPRQPDGTASGLVSSHSTVLPPRDNEKDPTSPAPRQQKKCAGTHRSIHA